MPIFKAKRSFGQNFLIDPNIVRKIVKACAIQPTETVLEIGPGLGALTSGIQRSAKRVIAVEKDRVLACKLMEEFHQSNIEIIQQDFLKYPLKNIGEKVKIVGNLPYNVSTPIITKLLENIKIFSDIYLTVQWEYGKRIIAKANTPDYGSFSCYVQYYASPEMLFKIKNTSFRPAPKVQSCFLRLAPLKQPQYSVKDEESLFRVIRAAFGQRRKTIQKSLSKVIDKPRIAGILNKAGIDPKARAENLALKDFVAISNLI